MARAHDGDRTYIRPFGFLAGPDAQIATAEGAALCLAGGPLVFTHAELTQRHGSSLERTSGPVAAFESWCPTPLDDANPHISRLTSARTPIAGMNFNRPRFMGVINVTPDSFSDGGDFDTPSAAVSHGRKLIAEGADILDVGGESTRPGAEPITQEEELARVLPVIEELSTLSVPLSIDSRNAKAQTAALMAGAQIINDVSALQHDPDSLRAAAKSDAPVILMHAQGDPKTMQQAPTYDDVVLDVYDALEARIKACEGAGIARSRIIVDPGIGFGKTVAHNLSLLRNISLLHGLGCPVLVGVSRKSFIGRLSKDEAPKDRLPGSLSALTACINQGVQFIRVHDVAESVQAAALWGHIALGET